MERRGWRWAGVVSAWLALVLGASCTGGGAEVKPDAPVTDPVDDDSDDEVDGPESSETLVRMRAMRQSVEELGTIASKGSVDATEHARVLEILETLEAQLGDLKASGAGEHANAEVSLDALIKQVGLARSGAESAPPTYTEAVNVATLCLNCHSQLP